jgi:hypothetical protein
MVGFNVYFPSCKSWKSHPQALWPTGQLCSGIDAKSHMQIFLKLLEFALPDLTATLDFSPSWFIGALGFQMHFQSLAHLKVLFLEKFLSGSCFNGYKFQSHFRFYTILQTALNLAK